jgi:uncharacterized damage-inducible protein DinB
MHEQPLYQAVSQLANATHALPDEALEYDWAWRDHDEGLRFALIGTYHELRDLAVTLASGRQAEDSPITIAQHVLAQYHAALRDLEAVLFGASDDDLDQTPAEGEWPLRRVLAHMIGAERVFFTLVYFGVDRYRAGLQPSELSDDDLAALFGHEEDDVEQVVADGSLEDILEYFRALHDRVLHEMADLTDEEQWALSRFWEPEPLPVRYRLHRFDAHLRQHTIQVEKTLAALDRVPNEAVRLLRLVYNALAEVEGTLIGAWEFGYSLQEELAAQIIDRCDEVAAITAKR